MGLFNRNRKEEVAQDLSPEEIQRLYESYVSIGGTAKALVVARDITEDECPWISPPLKAGQVVYRFTRPTYGCCDLEVGIPVSTLPNEYPAFEVPRDALVGEL